MLKLRGRQILAAILLTFVLLITACSPKAPDRFDQVQHESTQKSSGLAVAKTATQGAKFNKFFPKSEDGFQRVFTQEKKGFVEAVLKKDGKVIAQMAVSDTISTPEAAAKFNQSTQQIAGYPAVEVGKKQTAILVNQKYQVKVISKDPLFSSSDRSNWIQKFNLDGLASLK
jgi:hypothetical protein